MRDSDARRAGLARLLRAIHALRSQAMAGEREAIAAQPSPLPDAPRAHAAAQATEGALAGEQKARKGVGFAVMVLLLLLLLGYLIFFRHHI